MRWPLPRRGTPGSCPSRRRHGDGDRPSRRCPPSSGWPGTPSAAPAHRRGSQCPAA
jgi:hypothetical protein